MPHPVSASQRHRTTAVLLIVLVGICAIAAGAVTWLLHRDREQEWQRGGADVHMAAEVRATTPAQYGDTLAELGLAREPGRSRVSQMIVVHVRWTGTPDEDGSYEFIMLDDRVSPAEPVGGHEAVGPGGATGPNWDGRYDVVTEHYPWLVGLENSPDGSTDGPDALGVSAVSDGEATLSYWLGPRTQPTAEPEEDLVLAVVYVTSSGDVRWAKQLPMEPLA